MDGQSSKKKSFFKRIKSSIKGKKDKTSSSSMKKTPDPVIDSDHDHDASQAPAGGSVEQPSKAGDISEDDASKVGSPQRAPQRTQESPSGSHVVGYPTGGYAPYSGYSPYPRPYQYGEEDDAFEKLTTMFSDDNPHSCTIL